MHGISYFGLAEKIPTSQGLGGSERTCDRQHVVRCGCGRGEGCNESEAEMYRRKCRSEARYHWESFLCRHNPVWERIPTTWMEGAFIGNGRLGAMIYKGDGEAEPGADVLAWTIGRSDLFVFLLDCKK